MKILNKLSKNVSRITPYEPGKPIEDVARELGLDPDTIIKLAANENPLGPSPLAVDAIKAAAPSCHLYPDGGTYELRGKLAHHYGLERENFLIGNGSNEILELVGHCFLNESSRCVFSEYAFVVYKLVSTLFGAEMAEVKATPMLGHNLEAMAEAINESTRVVFVCSPNNPTGTMLGADEIAHFMDRVPDDVLVVFDEAYAEIAQGPMADTLQYVNRGRPVIVCRTFSKAYGLAGLRIGYAIGHPDLITALNRSRQPFNSNLIAQAAACAALDDQGHLKNYRKLCGESKAYFEQFCEDNHFDYVPSGGNFMLIKVGQGREVFMTLQNVGVIVRPMDGYGLPDYIRISYGTMDQNRRLAHALCDTLRAD